MDYREFVETTLENVREEFAGFTEPDEDIIPKAMMESRDGTLGLVVIDPQVMATVQSKDMLTLFLRRMAIDTNAHKLALVLSVWGIKLDPDDLDSAPPSGSFADDPRRVDQILVQVMDEERAETYLAEVKREDGKPPVLTDWSEPILETSGRFSQLQEALR